MRPMLDTPVDPTQLSVVGEFVGYIYTLHVSARPYAAELEKLSALVGRKVTAFDLDSAFGSVDSLTFAHDLLAWSVVIPDDITRAEILEMMQRMFSSKSGDETRHAFWLACLAKGTGDAKISDLIFWPGDYFGDGDNQATFTDEEILDIAEATARSGRATRPG